MRYEELIESVSEVINNDKIKKDGLVLVYELEELKHKKMDEHLFYMSNPANAKFEHKDVVEVEIGGIVVRFVKKDLED